MNYDDSWWTTAVMVAFLVLYFAGWLYLVVIAPWGIQYVGFDR